MSLNGSGVARVGGDFKLVMIQSSHRFGLAAPSPNLSEPPSIVNSSISEPEYVIRKNFSDLYGS